MAKFRLLASFLLLSLFSSIQAQKSIDINASAAQSFQTEISDDPLAVKMPEGTERYRRFDYNKQLANLQADNISDTLLLNFFDNKQYKAVIQRVIVNDIGKTVITAQIIGYDFDYCYIVVSDKTIAISADVLQEDEHFFAAEKDGQIYIRQMKRSVLDKDRLEGSEPLIEPTLPKPIQEKETLNGGDVESFNSNIEDTENIEPMNGPTDPATIDLLFVYTQSAATWAATSGGGINNVIDLAVAQANTVMTNSNAGVTFNVAHRHLTGYTETNTSDDFYRFSDYGDGYMDEIHDLRNTFYADVMVFLANISYTGGTGWLLNNLNGFSNDTRASCICRVQQSASGYTVIHEIGHNMGAQHHRDQVTQGGPNTSLPAPLNECSAGWKGTISGTKYCTVMTYTTASEYGESLPNYTRIPYFSSPLLTYSGTTIGNATTMDNTRVIRETKTATAAYRTAPTTPTITVSHNMISFSGAPTATKMVAVSAMNTTGNITYTLSGANPEVFAVNTHSTWIQSQGGILNITFSGLTTQNYEATLTISCTGAASKVINLKHITCSAPVTYIEESFDENVFPPDCWESVSADNTPWKWINIGTYPDCTPHSGSGMLQFNIRNFPTTGTKGLLITPQMASNNQNYTLKFWMFRDNYNASNMDRVNVYLSATNSISGLTPVTTVHRYRGNSPSTTNYPAWNEYTVNLPTASMSSFYVIFEGVNDARIMNIYVDDIRIYTPTINASPTSLAFGEVSTGTTSPTQTITVSGIALTGNITATKGGTNAAAFNVTPTSLSSTGGTINVTFSPTATGSHSATLTLSNTTTGVANKVITLSGTGVSPIIPVTNITGVPTTTIAGTPLTLTGTVVPNTATNQTIVWSVFDAGTTGATITGNTLNTTAAGTVIVRATIANGLSTGDYTQNFDITVSPCTITVGINPPSASICAGNNTTLTATGASSYLWSPATDLSATTGASVTASPTTTTTYTVTGTTGSCSGQATVQVSVDPAPTAGITNNPNTTVLTCTTPTISLTATGGGTYLWDNGLGNNANASVSTAGTYTVTVTSTSGCTATSSITISENKTAPTAGISNNSGTTILTCADPAISLSATGGGTYSWNNGLGTNANASVTAAGTYTVTVTGANGCTDTESISITENKTAPVAGITNNSGTTILTCANPAIDLTATGNGTYSWSNGLGTNANASVTAAGTYTVTVTAANSCTDTKSITITEDKAKPTAVISNNSGTTVLTCTNPAISLTAAGGISYSWSNGLGNSANATVTEAGTYTVTVTAANGCTDTESITISTDESMPIVGIRNNTGTNILTCTNPAISLTATGGVSYSWSNGLGNNADATVTTAGTYTVTVTAENGCAATENISITENKSEPVASITNNSGTTILTCTDPIISLTAAGGVSYSWSNGLGNNANATVTIAGTYTVTVTAENGCTDTESISITENKTEPVAGITNNSGTTILTCTTTISLTATGGVSYSWSNGLGNSANATINTAGTYTVTVTAANGCTDTESITITTDESMPVVLITNISATTVLTCTNPTISLIASGGINYSWSNGLGNNANATVTAAGTYTVTVTAANGCTDTESITITENKTPPVAGITNNSGTTILTCINPSISLAATGGVSYSWSNGLGNNANTTVTAAGTYTVTVTAANGCTDTQSISITENKTAPVAIITNNSGTTALTCTNPTISLTATGGGSYSWNNGLGNNANATVTTAGTYTVTVTAANGCTDSKSITITSEVSMPIAGITNNSGTTMLTCTNPTISLTATGGVSYSWNNGLGNNANAIVNTAGTYTVTVTGANGCTAIQSITITAVQSLPTITVNNAEICQGSNVTLTASGADTYTWTPGSFGASITVSPATTTTYTVEGTITATGCKNTATATVYVETPLTLTLASTSENIKRDDEITITVTADGPSHGVYEWFINNQLYTTTGENYITLQPAVGAHLFRVDARTTNLNCFATSNVLAVQVSDDTAISGVLASAFQLYPNPVKQGKSLNMKLSKELTDGVLSIYDVTGSLKKRQTLPAVTDHSIDTSDLMPGIWLFQIVGKDGYQQVAKIVVE